MLAMRCYRVAVASVAASLVLSSLAIGRAGVMDIGNPEER
jgi:hypothetical protein